MPKRPKGWFDRRSGRWYARVGAIDPRTGARRQVALRDEQGQLIRDRDVRGAQAAVERMLRSDPRDLERLTVRDVCAAYLDWQPQTGAAERTIKDHTYRLAKWCDLPYRRRLIGDLPADEIGPPHLWAFDSLRDRRHVYLSVLACWRWAARPVKGRDPISYVPVNTLAGLERPAVGRREVWADWPTSCRICRLAWRWARSTPANKPVTGRNRLRMVLALMLVARCGARPKEVAGLAWAEVQWETGTIAVAADRDKRRRKGRKPRVGRWIVVPRPLMTLLRYLRRIEPGQPWPITQATAFAHWWRTYLLPALRAVGYEVPEGLTLYGLRHGAIHRRVILQGVSPEQAALEFGTSAKAIHSHYLHPGESDVIRASGRSRRP